MSTITKKVKGWVRVGKYQGQPIMVKFHKFTVKDDFPRATKVGIKTIRKITKLVPCTITYQFASKK